MATGKKRESFGNLMIGFTEAKVVAICPTNDQLRKLGVPVKEDAAEADYVKDKDVTVQANSKEITKTVKQARIDIWFKYVGLNTPDKLFKKSYFVTDTISDNKTHTKIQYVNQTGDSQWVEDETKLPDYFTQFRKGNKKDGYKVIGDKAYRIAKKGEADLLEFVKIWLGDLDYYDPSTNILMDLKKIFAGKFGELQEQIDGDFDKTTTENVTVRVNDADGKEYQSVWKKSLPGYVMKTIRNTDFSDKNMAKWDKEKYDKNDNPDGRYLKDFEKFAFEMKDADYGCGDFFKLAPLAVYNSEENLAASDSPIGDEVDDDDEVSDGLDY